MRGGIGPLSVVGLRGLLATAEAASPYDGTYQLAGSTKVNQTYVSSAGSLVSARTGRRVRSLSPMV